MMKLTCYPQYFMQLLGFVRNFTLIRTGKLENSSDDLDADFHLIVEGRR